MCGSPFPEVNDAFAQAFRSPTLRVYSTADLRGLEWASALVGWSQWREMPSANGGTPLGSGCARWC